MHVALLLYVTFGCDSANGQIQDKDTNSEVHRDIDCSIWLHFESHQKLSTAANEKRTPITVINRSVESRGLGVIVLVTLVGLCCMPCISVFRCNTRVGEFDWPTL